MTYENKKNLKISLILLCIVLVLWSTTWILTMTLLAEWSDRGTFGDMFGSVNALFSGLAFAGVIFAIYLQSKELSLQREELVLTRNELEGQKEQLKLQNQTTKIQQFEFTYFNMLNNLQNILDAMVADADVMVNREQKGREYLRHISNELTNRFKKDEAFQSQLKMVIDDEKQLAEQIRLKAMKVYEPFFFNTSYNLGHYFRYIHNIIKYVRKQINDHEKQKMYLSYLQAQLSNDEMYFILVNSLSKFSKNKEGKALFREWLDEYQLLENIDGSQIIDKSILRVFFPNTDFYCLRNV